MGYGFLPSGIGHGQCTVNKKWKLFNLISGRNETVKMVHPLEGLWRRSFIDIFLAEIGYNIKVFMIGMFFRFRNPSNVMDPCVTINHI
jgi:hypothetical protein